MKTIPGVTDAAVGSGAPMEDQGSVQRFHTAGKPLGTMNERSITEYERATPNYFHVTESASCACAGCSIQIVTLRGD